MRWILRSYPGKFCAVQRRKEVEECRMRRIAPRTQKTHKINDEAAIGGGGVRGSGLLGRSRLPGSQLSGAPQERPAMPNSVNAAHRRKSAAHSSASQFPQTSGCVSRSATHIHIASSPRSVTSPQPDTGGRLAMACEFYPYPTTVNFISPCSTCSMAF